MPVVGSYSCAVVARLADLSDPLLHLVVGLLPYLEVLYTETRGAEHGHLHCAECEIFQNFHAHGHHVIALTQKGLSQPSIIQ